MSRLEFTDAAVERLEALNLGEDLLRRKAEVLRRLALQPGERVLDIGSGPGFLCEDMADAVGPTGEVRGVDLSAQLIERASARNDRYWLEYAVDDATWLQERSERFDVVVSVQVAEYVPDIHAFCREFWRTMKPGARGLIVATDWDAVSWHSDDPVRMSRVLRAFEGHCSDPRLPQHLADRIREVGLTVDCVDTLRLVNREWTDQRYGKGVAGFIRNYVESDGGVARDEAAAWYAELEHLAREGRYLFETSWFIFEVSRSK